MSFSLETYSPSPTCFAPGFVSSLDGTLAGHVGDMVDEEGVDPQQDEVDPEQDINEVHKVSELVAVDSSRAL